MEKGKEEDGEGDGDDPPVKTPRGRFSLPPGSHATADLVGQPTYTDVFRKLNSKDGSSITSTSLPDQEEPAKVIITESVPAALQRCAIHLIPIAASVIILTFNIKGTYLGADLMSPVKSETINLLLLQLAAKAHKVTIVASLGTVVLQFVRHELLFGDGLPLGLLGSGVTFNHFGFFFQQEFYGGVKYVSTHGNKPRKIMFVGLVVLAGMVAVLAGPASAVLLVPKSQDWKAGGTDFYLDGTEDQFWHSNLSDHLSDLHDLCAGGNSTRLAFCPAGGFYSLWTHWGTMNSTTFRTQDSLVPNTPLYALGDIQLGPNGRTSLTEPHAATVVVLQKVAEDWWEALTTQESLTSNQVDDRRVSANFKNAMTIARCAEPQRLAASEKTVRFPSIDGRFNMFRDNLPLQVDSLDATHADHLRFQWVHLPQKFGTASIGGLLEASWETPNASEASRAVVGCTIQAAWYSATSTISGPAGIRGISYFGDRTPSWVPTSSNTTNGRIAFGNDWLSLLTPPAPVITSDIDSWHPSTIESILLNAGLTESSTSDWLGQGNSTWERVSLVEAITSSVILDGLSRTGSHRVFARSHQPPSSSSSWSITDYTPLPDFASRVLENLPAIQEPGALGPGQFTSIHAEMKISGFSMQSSLASFLSMSVLLIHVLLATLHVLYVVRHRHTSGSWSTVGELIALSQNPQPAPTVLPNIGGGITRSSTYAQVAKMRVRRTPGCTDGDHASEHVELLFDDAAAPAVSDPQRARRRSAWQLDGLRDKWLLRHPATWPNRRFGVLLTADEDGGLSASASAERLVPQSTESQEMTGIVQLDRPYG